jgi:RNA polymerase sigma-70 factor (ECF subfamily)
VTDRAVASTDLIGWGRASVREHVDAVATSDPAEVYRQLAPAVLGYLRARGAAEPEDLTGDVFVDVTRNLHRFRGDEQDLRAWVFTIARRRCVDDHRRRVRRPATVGSDLASIDVPDRGRVDSNISPDLAAALSRLTANQREVLLLRYVADLPHREIAHMLHRRTSAVKALQRRGLDRLAELLADE